MGSIDPTKIIATTFDDWNPKIVGKSQGKLVKYTAFQGKAVRPPQVEDELFVVLTGQLMLASGDSLIMLDPEEFVVIPKNVEYEAIAPDEVALLIWVPYSSSADESH